MYELLAAIVAGVFGLVGVWMAYRLNQIHTLVNSNLTVALQAGLIAQAAARAAVLEVSSVAKLTKPETLALLRELDASIEKSKTALQDRTKG